jgi:hypothetical protein
MHYSEYKNVRDFLAVAEPYLMRDECVNSLMLGICLRLIQQPGFDCGGSEPPFFATVTSEESLHIAALRTPPRKNMHIYAANAEELDGLDTFMHHLSRSAAGVPAVFALTPVAHAFAQAWTRESGTTAREGTRQRVHRLETVVHPDYPPGEMRPATEEELDLVREWARGFQRDCFHEPPDERTYADAEKRVVDRTLFLWDDGTPHAMAARNRPTPNGECISYVYTPPEHRKRGYASALVARLSQTILDEGKSFCTLFTDLGNLTSNSIYRKIGYTGIADYLDIGFAGQ